MKYEPIWTWALMIILSPVYLLAWIALIVMGILLLAIGIVMAGWEQVTRQ